MKRGLIALLLGITALLSQPTLAQGYGSERIAPALALQQRVDALTGYLARHPETSAGEVRAFLDDAIAPLFDFDQMAYLVAGPINRYLSPNQRPRFVASFRDIFLDTIASRLAGISVGSVVYLPPRGNPAQGRVNLALQVIGNGVAVQLDFKLVEGRNGWRIIDISANGISAVGYFRQHMSNLVREQGLPALLNRMGR